MPNRISNGLWLSVVAIVVLAFVAGCSKKEVKVKTTPAKTKRKTINYEKFAPLDEATFQIDMPFIVGAKGNNDCFKPISEIEPIEADLSIKQLVEKKSAYVHKVLVDWMVDELMVDGLSRSFARKWEIDVEDLVVMEMQPDQLRFVDEGPRCLTNKGWLDKSEHLAATVIGAHKFHFKTTMPLGPDLTESMVQSLSTANMLVESEALFYYEPAMDVDGAPMFDAQENQLFTSPSGDFILEKDIPPPELRKMSEWTLTSEQPLYFAFRQYPKDGWRKESKKDLCNVIIIPGVLNPQPPDCEEFQESSFSVTIMEEGKPVSLTITTGEDNKGLTMDWGEAVKVQVNDRIILWLMPEKVEVGVKLWLNSLTINPEPMAGGSGNTGYGYEDDSSYSRPSNKKEKSPDNDVPEKKKKKNSTGNAIDDYLSY